MSRPEDCCLWPLDKVLISKVILSEVKPCQANDVWLSGVVTPEDQTKKGLDLNCLCTWRQERQPGYTVCPKFLGTCKNPKDKYHLTICKKNLKMTTENFFPIPLANLKELKHSCYLRSKWTRSCVYASRVDDMNEPLPYLIITMSAFGWKNLAAVLTSYGSRSVSIYSLYGNLLFSSMCWMNGLDLVKSHFYV